MVVDACSLLVPEHRVQPEEGLVKSGGNSDPQLKGVATQDNLYVEIGSANKSRYMLETQMIWATYFIYVKMFKSMRAISRKPNHKDGSRILRDYTRDANPGFAMI